MLLDFHLLGARTCIGHHLCILKMSAFMLYALSSYRNGRYTFYIGHHLCILKMAAFRLFALSSYRNGRYTFYPLYNKYRAILSAERLILVLRSVVHLLFWAIKMHCLFCFSKLESDLSFMCSSKVLGMSCLILGNL